MWIKSLLVLLMLVAGPGLCSAQTSNFCAKYMWAPLDDDLNVWLCYGELHAIDAPNCDNPEYVFDTIDLSANAFPGECEDSNCVPKAGEDLSTPDLAKVRHHVPRLRQLPATDDEKWDRWLRVRPSHPEAANNVYFEQTATSTLRVTGWGRSNKDFRIFTLTNTEAAEGTPGSVSYVGFQIDTLASRPDAEIAYSDNSVKPVKLKAGQNGRSRVKVPGYYVIELMNGEDRIPYVVNNLDH